jgi:hypothetical protein
VRRRDPGEPLAACRERGERRAEQAQLADAIVRGQELGEAAGRPAAAGQFRVERREAGRHARARHLSERVAAPDVGAGEEGGERSAGVGEPHCKTRCEGGSGFKARGCG